MQINSITSLYQPSSGGSSSTLAVKNEPAVENSASSVKEKSKPLYDMHNMSINELNEMTAQMYSDGELSEDDYMRIGVEQMIMELFSGYSPDTKVDLLALVKNGLDSMKANPDSEGVDYVQQTFDLLNGIDARQNATIPSFV